MSIFTAGPNGANVLETIESSGTIVNETPSSSEIVATYSDGSQNILYGNFVLSGGTLTGGTLTGWSSFRSDGVLNWSITGFSASISTIALDQELGLESSITALIFTTGSTYYGSANPNASDVLIGFGSDTYIGGAATELIEPAAGTNTIKGGTGSNTVKFAGSLSSYSIVNNGNDALTVTDSVASRNGVDHISGVQTLEFVDVTATVNSSGTLVLPTASVSQAISWGSPGDVAPLSILDYSSAVLANMPALENLANAGKIGSITLEDTVAPTLSLSPTQLSADLAVLKTIVSSATVDVDASGANLTLTGVGSLGTVAVFTKPVADYSVVANSDGSVTVTDVSTGRTSVDHLSNFAALQFSDQTDIVAAAPASGGAASTGNVTELYAAALNREPDVSGLTFYQNYLKANPLTQLQQFAEWFLTSSEYTKAHAYPQSAAGDAQFITDSYENLLHRAPTSAEVAFYQTNIMAPAETNLTPGTQAFSQAQLGAHALMLVYFSNSAEFLSDVQVTGQASGTGTAQHWLVTPQ